MNTSAMVKAALIAALTAATSLIKVSLPFTEVPLTLQVFFSLLAGATLGPAYGGLSMLVYVLMGVVGLPVFAGGTAGLGVLFGPTGGYLFGFIAAAFVVGFIISKGKVNTLRLAVAMVAGIFVIYLLGVLQLAFVNKLAISQAILLGAAPFILLDMIKAFVAAAVARGIGLATGKQTN